MNDKAQDVERVVKEYPRSSRWIEGNLVLGSGNLILTTKRLIFLHEVVVTPKIEQKLRELDSFPGSRTMDYAITLHKNNFQIPLTSIVTVKTGTFALFPIPRFCLRVTYAEGKRQQNQKTASFMFTIPLLKGFFQFEITTVLSWVWTIKAIMRNRGLHI